MPDSILTVVDFPRAVGSDVSHQFTRFYGERHPIQRGDGMITAADDAAQRA